MDCGHIGVIIIIIFSIYFYFEGYILQKDTKIGYAEPLKFLIERQVMKMLRTSNGLPKTMIIYAPSALCHILWRHDGLRPQQD